MTQPLTLVLFDVDGTLVDSQAHIYAAMEIAFGNAGLAVPARDDVLSIVGLSLPEAFARLCPDHDHKTILDLVEGYKAAFAHHRMKSVPSPLFPGAKDVLNHMATQDHILLGVATGKSRRGLNHVLDAHDLKSTFVTEQVADFHPSKPHPAMALEAMAESGADRGIMIGDTSFDMEMGKAAKLATIGVTWGYHPTSVLSSHADYLIHDYRELWPCIQNILGD